MAFKRGDEMAAAAEMAGIVKRAFAGESFTMSSLLKQAGEAETIVTAVLSVMMTKLAHEIGRLEVRLAAVEQAPAKAAGPSVKYAGIWNGVQPYSEGSLTTHRGGLWCAKTSSLGKRPGIDHDFWTLVVKSGTAE